MRQADRLQIAQTTVTCPPAALTMAAMDAKMVITWQKTEHSVSVSTQNHSANSVYVSVNYNEFKYEYRKDIIFIFYLIFPQGCDHCLHCADRFGCAAGCELGYMLDDFDNTCHRM